MDVTAGKYLFIIISFLLVGTCETACKKAPLNRPENVLSVSNFNMENSIYFDFFIKDKPDKSKKQVQLIQLEGIREDVLRKLLEGGYLPHFEFLLKRGKISYTTLSIDKAENMNGILSYLTGKRNTSVVSSRQFNRENYQFRNFESNPIDIISNAVGTEFPLFPSIYDYLNSQGKEVLSGIGTHRRGIPERNYNQTVLFENSSINNISYYEQTNVDIKRLITDLKTSNIGKHVNQRNFLSQNILSVANEYARINGVQWKNGELGIPGSEYCLDRNKYKDGQFEPLFRLIEEHGYSLFNGFLIRSGQVSSNKSVDNKLRGYFSTLYSLDIPITHESNNYKNITKICIPVEKISFENDLEDGNTGFIKYQDNYVNPLYELAIIYSDMQIAKIIDTLRRLQYNRTGFIEFNNVNSGIKNYINQSKLENSQFENTLFLLFGGHGIVDTRHFSTKSNTDPNRDGNSLQKSFVEYLNDELKLPTANKDINYTSLVPHGIDDKQLPLILQMPFKYKSWQTGKIYTKEFGNVDLKDFTTKAENWARDFLAEGNKVFKDGLFKKIWNVILLKKRTSFHKNEAIIEISNDEFIDSITQLYLSGEPGYVQAERAFKQQYMDSRVAFVQAGSGLNNAEIFIPGKKGNTETWLEKPTFDEIMTYKPSFIDKTLLEILKKAPPVGLIFIRKENADIKSKSALPNPMHILVMDKNGGEGLITVTALLAPGGEKEIIYKYTVSPGLKDPLQYINAGIINGFEGTFNEWNDLTIAKKVYYPNVVGGIGQYLYTANSAVGDILLMHAPNWNFGENAGGNGGLDWGEKMSFLAVSGPQLTSGNLMAVPKYVTSSADKKIVLAKKTDQTQPTILDLIPSALYWLGEGEGALTKFSRLGFAEYYRKWNVIQQQENSLEGIGLFKQVAKEMGLPFNTTTLYPKFNRLLQFMPKDVPDLPNYFEEQENGNVLNFTD